MQIAEVVVEGWVCLGWFHDISVKTHISVSVNNYKIVPVCDFLNCHSNK